MHNLEKRKVGINGEKTGQDWILMDFNLSRINTEDKYMVINICAPNHYKEK